MNFFFLKKWFLLILERENIVRLSYQLLWLKGKK